MIGGSVTAALLFKSCEKNQIGESVPIWHEAFSLTGWLDLAGGDSKHTIYSAKVQESTHVFICDYREIYNIVEGKKINVPAENCMMVINEKHYDVMLIDDPMELHMQLEIYLKYTGGQ